MLSRSLRTLAPRLAARALSTAQPSQGAFVIVASGPNRTGIVRDATKIIGDAGGNVSQSRAHELASVFCASMVVEVSRGAGMVVGLSLGAPPQGVSGMHLQPLCLSLKEALPGFSVEVRGVDLSEEADTFSAELSVEMADDIGIISSVTDVVGSHGLNIAVLDSTQEIAPFGGTTLFALEGVVTAKGPVNLDALQADLGVLEETRGVSGARRAVAVVRTHSLSFLPFPFRSTCGSRRRWWTAWRRLTRRRGGEREVGRTAHRRCVVG